MGIISDYKRRSAEKTAYRKIVAKKTALASRQAYAEEAVKVARERAKARARKPLDRIERRKRIGKQIVSYAIGKATSPPSRSPTRRARTRRTPTRRTPTRRKSSKRKTVRRSYPVKRVEEKRPQTVSEALYGY